MINGDAITTGSLNANRIVARTIDADKLATNSVTSDKILANEIGANKLVIQSRPLSTVGLNFRINADNATVSWDAGEVRFVDDNNNMQYFPVNAAGPIPYQGNHMYFFYTPPAVGVTASRLIDYNTDSANLGKNSVRMIAVWKGGTDLTVLAGVGTSLNGDRIVTGTVNANKIIARTITADRIGANEITANEIKALTITSNEIKAGTIGAAQIAAGAISANNLYVGATTEGLLANGGAEAGSSDGWTGQGSVTANGNGSGFAHTIAPSSGSGYFSKAFPVTPGKSYNVNWAVKGSVAIPSGVYFRMLYQSAKPTFQTGGSVFSDLLSNGGATTAYVPASALWVAPAGAAWVSVVLYNTGSTGTVYFDDITVFEQVAGTRIQDGAITTLKMTANSINGDRITADTLSADKIKAGSIISGSITVGGVGGTNTIANAFNTSTWAGTTGAGKPADNATSDLLMVVSPGSTATASVVGNTVTQTSSVTGWSNLIISKTTYYGNAVVMGVLSTASTFLGLTVTPNSSGNAQYTSLTYSVHCSSATAWLIYENGSGTTLGASANGVTFSSSTVWQITYDGVNVKYYADGVLIRSIGAAANLKVYAGVCLGGLNCSVTRIGFNAFTDNVWGNVGGTNKPADNATVGAPSGTSVGNVSADVVANNITAITSDNILSPAEKPLLYTEWQRMVREEGNLYGRATEYVNAGKGGRYDIQSKRDLLSGSLGNLNTTINGFSPALSSFETSTNINGANLRGLFADFYLRVEPVKLALQSLAAESGDWGLVVSKPANINSLLGSESIKNTDQQWIDVNGAGKPETYTVMSRGNQNTTKLPANWQHGLRGSNGQVFVDSLDASLRSDSYARSYTLCWRVNPTYWAIRNYDVYANEIAYPNVEGSAKGATALGNQLNALAVGTPFVIYTSDEPSNNRGTGGLLEAMLRCGASRAVFASPNFTSWSSYVLIGTIGMGEGNGLEVMSSGGDASYVMTSFSIVNGIVTSGGKTLKDATDISFSDGRGVNALSTVEAGATVGAPAGTSVGGIPAVDIAASITAITSDNSLSPAEKPLLYTEWQRCVKQENTLWSRASEYVNGGKGGRYDIEAKRNALSQSVANLSNYVNSFNPAITSFETVTSISGSNLRNLFADYYAKCEIVLIGLQLLAAESSDWGQVTGGGKPADNATVGAPAGSKVGNTSATDVETRANNPAATVNAGTVQIDGGKIKINGTTTLNDWRNGNDSTEIKGGAIAANSIKAGSLQIGARNLNFENINFEVQIVSGYQELTWSKGYLQYVDDSSNGTVVEIAAGNTLGYSKRCFIYWIKGEGSFRVGTAAEPIVGNNNAVMIGTYMGGNTFNATYGTTTINGERITTGSINADRISAYTILSNSITISGLPNHGNLGDAMIRANDPASRINQNTTTIDGGKITTGSLDAGAIRAGTVLSNFVQVGGTGFGASFDIGAAMIAANDPANRINNQSTTISGGKITTGSIEANKLNVTSLSAISANIGLLRTATSGARTEIEANQIRVYDSNNVLRVRMGVW
jgi:hypothetical protein